MTKKDGIFDIDKAIQNSLHGVCCLLIQYEGGVIQLWGRVTAVDVRDKGLAIKVTG